MMKCLKITAACALAACALAATLLGQSENAALQGFVRDSQGQPVAAAAVQLKTGGQTLTTTTDAQGSYRFQALQAGSYTLHASESKLGEANFGPFPLGQQETRKVDLALDSAAKAQFFDQPTFIVAGVTDPSQRGGHGSDPVLRSAEALAKETASLRTGTSGPADAEEKQGNALQAAREYQRAAESDRSEANLFNWGAELLKHRAADQAVEVFTNGNRLFPRSTRMLLGLAVALYSRGSYDQAAQRFFEAADLNPSDPAPYMFLGKISNGPITESSGFAERLERFARLHPENAWANYFYAATLTRTSPKARSLLEKAVRLDPKLGQAFLLLGIVYAEEGNVTKAIAAYQSAIGASPPMEEAHYRLAQAYRKTGDTAKAQQEIELYQQLSRQSTQKFERERAEIQQFVFALKTQ
jgi:tetratricopeptide (TPR) repeat protein